MSRFQPSENQEKGPANARVAIIRSRFNESITSSLQESCIRGLRERGMSETAITLSTVPGAFELPFAAKQLAQTGRYDAVICLGAVIRGDTPHFEYVSAAAADGILKAGLETGVPVIFGVLTVDSMEQAMARVGENASAGDKGREAGMTAVDMILWRNEFVPHG